MRYFIIAAVLLSVGILAPAQTVPSQAPPDTVQLQNVPVPVPEPSQKALEYHASGNILWMVDVAWGFLIPAVFLFTGLSSKIRTWAGKLGKRWFFTVGIYFIIFSAIFFVINLPLSYYEDFVRQHAYDLSNQTFGKWFGDALKGLMVGIIIGFLFLWIPYLLLEKSPKRWWLYVGILMMPFTILALIVSPIWIEPLFNDFGPMKNKVLEAKILALADRAGIEGSRVYEVNKSVDTKKVNAYVTGFMGSKRIVLWDNTINKLNEKELLFVMAHEMGHYVLGHVWKLIAFISLISLLTLYLAYLTAGAFVNRFKQRFGFDRLSDVASLPLILLLINFFGFLITPFANWYSRSIEHEADRFGLEITRSNHDAATAFVKLQMENLSVPRPGTLYTIWQADHPVLGDRIDFANEYKPWEKGEPLMYGEYFKP